MGIYAEYLDKLNNFEDLTAERKRILKKISELRCNRDLLVISADISKSIPQVAIDYTDILAVQDQLSNLSGKSIDIILETPGGFAEVVEDIVRLIRGKYERVGIIIPGYAKSAGTIFAMAGDEILMGKPSALGPIDAQIASGNGKRFSADAFLEGLQKIKKEVEDTKNLNIAYVPILQNISPGEIQHCENAQCFSQRLVTEWLENYKFKYWEKHSDGRNVTSDDRHKRAEEIAQDLCSQSKWLTHGRSIKIDDLEKLRVKITDYSIDPKLDDAITRYYTLLRMTFESTAIYKVFETSTSQIYRFAGPMLEQLPQNVQGKSAVAEIGCKFCNNKFKVQANFEKGMPLEPGAIPYPVETNIIQCPNCKKEHNLIPLRNQLESQTRRKIV